MDSLAWRKWGPVNLVGQTSRSQRRLEMVLEVEKSSRKIATNFVAFLEEMVFMNSYTLLFCTVRTSPYKSVAIPARNLA